MNDPVLVAIITAGFGFLGVLVQASRKENKADHGVVGEKLDNLVEGHARIEAKIDTHINDHAKGAFNQ